MRRGIRTVQRVRELVEQQALGALAVAEREVRVRDADLARARAAHRARPRPSVADASALRLERLAGIASLERVESADAELAASRLQRDRATELRIAASIARRSLDRLVERIEAREALDAQTATQRAADELALLQRRRDDDR